MTLDVTRRRFLTTTATALAGATAACAHGAPLGAGARLSPGGVVLFQGDSITDAGRTRTVTEANSTRALGTGYPLLIAAALLQEHPTAGWQFYNRGISGNKVPQLDERWEADALALKPAILSLLIGVNDYWHTKRANYSGTAADYERQLDALLARTRAGLPGVRLVILEPFVTRVGAVDASWFPEFDQRRAAAARAAERARATWVPLQRAFDEASARTGPAYWAADGVHPTAAGHALIARKWRDAIFPQE